MLETMYVRCTHCGYDNSPEYRFCGMCGSALAHQPVATKPSLREGTAPAETATEPASANGGHPENVHGPSFLGLADDPKEEFRYLYEDEPPRSYALLIFILVLLVAIGGAGYWQWRNNGFPFNRLSAQNRPLTNGPVPAPPAGQSQAPPTNHAAPAAAANPANPGPADQNTSAPAATNPAETAATNTQTPSSGEPPASTDKSAPSASQESEPAPQEPAAAKTEEPKAKHPESAAKAAKTRKRTSEPRQADLPAPAPVIPVAPDGDLELAGERYLYGNGLPQNCDRAETALRASADHGNSKAQTVLGTMYATGHCVGRDLPLAYRWFARALHQEPQNARIAEDLSVLWRQMTPQEKQLATAGGQ